MREIKFRVWDKENNCFYKPIYKAYAGELEELLIQPSGDLCMRTMNDMTHVSLFPDRFLVLQYTGLKDKNGTEIYEGDILQEQTTYPLEVFVEFGHTYVRYVDMEEVVEEMLFQGEIYEQDLEIIGNRFEHPHLLKEGVQA